MAKNRHGLDRNIPEPVRREVRRRCGFGCVICGSAIVTYEHMEPRFADATVHTAVGITLLCGQHQIESSKGLLSLETVKAADKDPFSRKVGTATYLLDIGQRRPLIMIGGNTFAQFGAAISVNGEPIFELRAPEKYSKLWRVSAKFKDAMGKVLCEIVENEIVVAAENIDFEQTSSRFVVATRDNAGFLELEALPPGGIALNKFEIRTHGEVLRIGRENLAPPGEKADEQMCISWRGTKFVNCGFSNPNGLDFKIKDGQFSI
jgi:hypothetical protein